MKSVCGNESDLILRSRHTESIEQLSEKKRRQEKKRQSEDQGRAY